MSALKVFLLAGQSNMQGFGQIAGYPVLRDERILNFATGNAEIAVEPLHHWAEHPYMPAGIGLGLAMPFALEILKEFPRPAAAPRLISGCREMRILNGRYGFLNVP